jgi:hypothetical protein
MVKANGNTKTLKSLTVHQAILNKHANNVRRSGFENQQDVKTINKNRLDKSRNFKKGDIVYALDRNNVPGNGQPLKTTFFPSPYILLRHSSQRH